MRRVSAAVLTFLLGVALFGPAQRASSSKRRHDKSSYRPGEVILKFKSDAPAINSAGPGQRLASVARFVVDQFGDFDRDSVTAISPATLESRVGKIIHGRGLDRTFVLKIEAGADVEAAVAQLRARDDVEYAEPNYRIQLGTIPNDPYFRQQWALRNLGVGVGEYPSTANADIKAYAAWDVTAGAGDVVVALTDTGVDQTHPELADNIYTNHGEIPNNGIDDDNNGYVDDVHGYNVAEENSDTSDLVGHGTQMAGLIAAESNNNIGIAGVSQSKILPVRFFKRTGPFPEQFDATVSDAARALVYSIAAGATIINASWRTLLAPGDVPPEQSEALRDAVAATNDAGALLVCVAGNEGYDNDYSSVYPGAYQLPNQIVVAASDYNDELWHPPYYPYLIQSGFGKHTVHLAAPGVSVLTTLARGDCLECSHSADPADWYGRADGTSISAALVSGVAALVKSRYPDDNGFVLKRRILEGVQKVDTPNQYVSISDKVISGGRLDAAGALAVHVEIVRPELSSVKYKKGAEKLIVFGENIQRGVRVIIDGKGYDAKPKGGGLTAFKLNVPKTVLPSGVAITIKLVNPDGGESNTITYSR